MVQRFIVLFYSSKTNILKSYESNKYMNLIECELQLKNVDSEM